MELSVPDRMGLLTILPAQGDITTLRIVRELREALSFSEAEHKELGLVVEGDSVRWDGLNHIDKDIEIGPKATAIITEALVARNAAKALADSHLPLWDMFVGEQ